MIESPEAFPQYLSISLKEMCASKIIIYIVCNVVKGEPAPFCCKRPSKTKDLTALGSDDRHLKGLKKKLLMP